MQVDQRRESFPCNLIDAVTPDELRLGKMSVNGRLCPVKQSESMLQWLPI